MRKRRHATNMHIGHRLRSIREARGMAQGEAAKLMKLLRTSLINIEYGRQNVNLVQLERFAQIYDVTLGELLGEMAQNGKGLK